MNKIAAQKNYYNNIDMFPKIFHRQHIEMEWDDYDNAEYDEGLFPPTQLLYYTGKPDL